MKHTYHFWLTRRLARPLAALGLLLATAGAAQAQVTFSAPALYATAGNSQGIVTADFNGDGRPDLATANSGTSSVSVLLQSGTTVGTFLPAASYGSGGNFDPTLAVGDLNGDGRPDIATIHESSATVGVLLNSATTPGTFAAAVAYGTGNNFGRGIAVADINGDGRLDLITSSGTVVGVLLNSATTPGTFGAPTFYSGGGADLDELMVGDLNGDGRPDVVVGSRTDNTVSVLLNSATAPGTLGSASLYTVGTSNFLRGVALGDLNNDGRLDIATSNYNGQSVSVLLNSASTPGTFPAAATYSVGSNQNPYGVAIGDVNGDGLADLAASNYNTSNGNTISLFVNSATAPGTFATAPQLYTTGGTGTIRAVIRDLNADGRPDLAVSHIRSQDVGVLLNTTVFAAPTLTSISPNPAAVGTSVTLTGTNLGSATAVRFNGTAATTFAVVNATTITATVPTGATSGPVTVTAGGGTSGGVQFTVLTSAPVLAGIETSVLPYAAGQAPTQLTSTLTLSDADSPNLTGATVAISSGFVAGDDLLFVNQSGITGSYNTGTGVLTLTGTAPVATYQAALRAIQFGPFGAPPTTAGDRVVQFRVSDGTNTSNLVTRTVRVVVLPTVATAAPGSITTTSAVLGGSITSDGGDRNGNSGIVYAQGTVTPTLANTLPSPFSLGGVTIGSFNGFVGGLLPGTTYTVRAFATNSAGTSYGAAVSFTTLAAPTTVVSLNRVGNSSTNASSVSFTVTFAAAVTGVSASNFALATTGSVAGASITGVSGSGTTYTVAVSTGTGDGTLGLNLTNATGLSPGVSNVPFAGQVYTIDKTAPTLVITSTTAPNGGYTTTTPINFVATSSESLAGNGLFTPASFAYVTNGTGVSISRTVSLPNTVTFNVPPAGIGAVRLTIPANAVTDVAGNGNAGPVAYTIYYNVPTAAPVLTSPAANSNVSGLPTFAGTAPAGSTVTIYLAVGGGAAQAIGTTTATGGTFSLAQPTALPDGTYAVYATAQSSGQAVSANSSTTPFTVGFVATLSSTFGASGSSTATLPFVFTATFSQPVTGFSASGISVSNGYVSSGPTGSGTTYTFAVTPSAPGATTVSLNAGAAQNAAGSPSPASNAYGLTYSLPLPPLPVLLTPADGSLVSGRFVINGRATAGSIVGVTITDIYTRTNRFFSTTAGSNGSFTITSVLGTGLPSSVYQISAAASLNGQQGVSNTNTFTVDATGPTVTISSAAGSSTGTAPIPFTISFSEPIQSLAASSVRVTNGAITSAIANVGNDYSFSVTPTAGGIVTVTLPTGAVQDQFGNNNSSTSALSVTYVVPITATAWTGAVSTDWFDASNWTQGVPTATVDATISPVSSGRYPLVAAGTAAARNLTLNSGASLTMSGGTLDVRATLANNSTFVATGGTVVLGTSTQGAIVGSSPTNFWSLQVERSGALLATSVGAAVRQVLTLNGNFDTNGNVFTLRSTAAATALVVNNGGVVSGTTTVQRAIDPSLNPGLGYRHYSAPVSNSTVADLATSGFTPTVNPAYNTSPVPGSVLPYPTVFGYDDSRLATTATSNNLSSFDKGYFSPSALSAPLAVGRGYTVNLSAREVVDFQGTLNNGDLTLPLTSTRPTFPDGGWQLLGNPYPAPLDYSRVAPADRPGLEAAIYVYSSISQYGGFYRSYVNGIGNPVLPLGQAFFTRVASGQPTASLTFRNAQRLTAPDPTAFLRPAAPTADPRPLVQLELRAGASASAKAAAADEFFAYAEAGATPAFDGQLDAEKLPNPTGFNLSSLAASGQPLAVDARAAFTAATVLPLSLGVPAPGPYALSAAALRNLPAGLDAYLADDLTGQVVRLSVGTSYAFSVSAAQATAPLVGRFRLLFRPATALATAAPGLSAADVAVFPNPARARFTVVLPGLGQASAVQAELLNALGQVVRRQQAALPASGTQLSFDTAELATGVYVLRLQAGAASLARRIVIE